MNIDIYEMFIPSLIVCLYFTIQFQILKKRKLVKHILNIKIGT